LGGYGSLRGPRETDPLDPSMWRTDFLRGSAHRRLNEFDEAIIYGRKACQGEGDATYLTHMQLAATLALAGIREEANACCTRAIEREPALSISWLQDAFAGGSEAAFQELVEGLRVAGLREV
jgi:hypothetical protein